MQKIKKKNKLSNTAHFIARKSLTSTTTSAQNDEMQVELRQMLTMFREKQNKLAIVKTPDIYIEQSASADEVEKWLEKKGFSEDVIKKLHNINGNELFALKLNTLKDALGEKDGKRLASQIEIQRNISGVCLKKKNLKEYLSKIN